MATIYYRVRARNAAGDSDPSNTDYVEIPEVPAGAPTDPVAEPYQNNHDVIQLSWGTVPEADMYEVYRSTTSGFTPGPGNKLATEPTASTMTDTTASSANTVYYYRLRAKNSAGTTHPNYSVEFGAATHLDRPRDFWADLDPDECPSWVFNLWWNNTNATGHPRTDATVVQWYDGSSWTTVTPGPSPGATTFTFPASPSCEQIRIRYATEGVYSTMDTSELECPE